LSVLVHPQSVVHSLVEYVDGSMLAQLGPADMRTPIAHTLAWPQRMKTPCEPLDLAAISRLDFEEADLDRFPALALALQALAAGGSRPGVLNAANEEAVAAFLEGRIGFLDIASIVDKVLSRYEARSPESIDEALMLDAETRRVATLALARQAA
jgi:1-deoxy-D-xylulose-5-phosphate reductoisomerase